MSGKNPYRSKYDNDFLKKVAEKMCDSLIGHAKANGVSLDGINDFPTLHELDDRFHDGGEARCEQFTDIGWEFASEYGTFKEVPDDEWEWAQSEVTETALGMLPERWEAAKPKKSRKSKGGK